MRYFFTLLILTILAIPVIGSGEFFTATTPMEQKSERIIFTVNGDGTVTVIIGVNYRGGAKDFSWLIPVPSLPEVSLVETASLDMLETATDKRFVEPTNYCPNLVYSLYGPGSGGETTPEGHIGPYDYTVLSENPVTWLRENGYQVADESIITEYANAGMHFIAIKLQQDTVVGDIQPIRITYQATKPTLPLRLNSVVENMPLMVWIFGEGQYVPENYANEEVDYTTFRAYSQINEVFDTYRPPFNYSAQVSTIQSEHNGLAFVTEYAQPTTALREAVSGDALLADLTQRFPYVTRLRAQFSPGQMTLDPSFVPAPDAADVSNEIMLEDYVDPLHYWGCSTRTIRNTEAETVLTQSARLDAFFNTTYVAYPEGWVMSRIAIGESPIYIFAPETVDETRLRAIVAGEDPLPIMTVTNYRADAPLWSLTDLLGLPHETNRLRQLPGSLKVHELTHYHLYDAINGESNYGTGWVYLVGIAPRDQWEEYEPILWSMLTYADSYQFYTDPELRHTLFLGAGTFSLDSELPVGAIGYPDGWIESLAEDETVLITPEDNTAVQVRLITISHFMDADYPLNYEVMKAPLMAVYGLSEVEFNQLIEQPDRTFYRRDRPFRSAIVPYEHDGRKGYLKLVEHYIIDVSAPTAEFETYEPAFQRIIDAYMVNPTPVD